MRVTILIPFGTFTTSSSFTRCLANLISHTTQNSKIKIDKVLTTERSMVHWAREALAHKALETGSSHFLWLDDDHEFNADALVRLAEYKDLPVVSALYCEKRTQQPIVGFKDRMETEDGVTYQRYKLPDYGTVFEGLTKVDCVGFGFLLMKRETLEAIKPPYFRFMGNEGEDSYFCSKLEQVGLSCFVDGDTIIGHYGQPNIVFPKIFVEDKPQLLGSSKPSDMDKGLEE